MTDLVDVSKVLGMNVTRDQENGTITIDQKDYTEDILERYRMTNCNVALTPGGGPEISLDQPADRLLDEQERQRCQSIAGVLIDVPRAVLAVRYPLRGQLAGEGNIQVLESSHGGGQTRTPVLGQVREFPDHLQARWL